MGRGPTIEGRKNVEDSRKAKIFTKLIREIAVAARGGGDLATNSALRAAVDKALSANMTKDTIERAVKRGSGAEGADNMSALRYEGYGPAGVALIIDCMTDNPQRTVADVRHALNKHGGNVGTTGSVAFQFTRVGELVFAAADATADNQIFELALEAGAYDVQNEFGETTVWCAPDQFEAVKKALLGAGLKPLKAAVIMRPGNYVLVTEDVADTLRDLLDRLEDLDDVQEVFHNATLPDSE